MNYLTSILPIVLMIGIFYFLLIRPQQKQMKDKQSMLDKLASGDRVVTIGGLHGIVDEVDHTGNQVILDCEGVYLTFDLRAIATVVKGGNIEAREEEIITTQENTN